MACAILSGSVPAWIATMVKRRASAGGLIFAITCSIPSIRFPEASALSDHASTFMRVLSSSSMSALAIRATATSRAARSRPLKCFEHVVSTSAEARAAGPVLGCRDGLFGEVVQGRVDEVEAKQAAVARDAQADLDHGDVLDAGAHETGTHAALAADLRGLCEGGLDERRGLLLRDPRRDDELADLHRVEGFGKLCRL